MVCAIFYKKSGQLFCFYEFFVYLRLKRKYMEKLTIQEEEAMQLIWRCNGGFVKELLDEMPGEKVPYTTLASTLKNLQRKGYVKAVRYANAYRYEPLLTDEDYKKMFMSGFVSDYFKNSYQELVRFFAKDEKISAHELKEIIDMIDQEKSK